MKFSLITATYNSGKTIRDTLESVLGQTYPDIEYIIVDGGSTDDTLGIIEEYAPRFNGRISIRSERDKGIYDAMNKGIARATGDIVGILNSDDIYIDGNVVADVVGYFEKNGCGAVYGNIYMVAENDLDKVVRNWTSSPFVRGSFSKGWHPPHPAFFIKREYYEKYGDFDLSLAVSADFELMLRMLEKHGVTACFMDRHVVKMRIGGESTGNISSIIRGNRNILRAFEKNGIKVNKFLYPIRRISGKLKQYL